MPDPPLEMTASTHEPCELLPWDTEFFGVRIARVSGHSCTAESLLKINRWCVERRISCLYFLGSSHDLPTPRLAEQDGFRLVDVRVTLSLAEPRSSGFPPENIRLVKPADLDPLLDLVPENAGDSRFFFDEKFPRDASARLYQQWLRQNYEREDAAVFVCGPEGSPTGYVTCERDFHSGGGAIGLLGVSKRVRGQGVGGALVASAIHWFEGQGILPMTVVTQARNVQAQRLYQRAGFLTREVQLWYHKWFQPQESA